jgi:uncharacterized damage-inducible protein DinB
MMSDGTPEPTTSRSSTTEVFDDYLTCFRSGIFEGVSHLPVAEQRSSRLRSGWTPLELMKHLTYVERRWLEWGFLGADVGDPWGDRAEGRWTVSHDETAESLAKELLAQGDRSRGVIYGTDLSERGQPGPRWNGDEPATLERILLHLLQEYARHLGHLDIVVELVGDATSPES